MHDKYPMELMTCYWLGAMPYVPHYRAPGVYVAPGGRERTGDLLKAMGATPEKRYLWVRQWWKL